MRDIELIDRVKQGQPKACYEFYYSYVDRVHRQLYAMVGPDADLDDLIQQTFISVFKRIDSFRGESRFTTWLHRVVVNVAIDHLRARKRKVRPDLEQDLRTLCAPSAYETPDEMLARSEKIALLHHILDGVKAKQRVVFMLYEVEGYTLEEIAEVVDASVNTVATRLRAARQEVRRAVRRRQNMDEQQLARVSKMENGHDA